MAEGAEFNLGAGGPLPPEAAADLLQKIISAGQRLEVEILESQSLDDIEERGVVVKSALVLAEDELADLEQLYAAQTARLQASRPQPSSPGGESVQTPPVPVATAEPEVGDPELIQMRATEIREVIRAANSQGVYFEAEVPEHCEETEEHAWPDRSRHPLLRSKRILLIDSDSEIQASAHQLLTPFGCTVETASNGEEGLQMAASLPYDVAIADVRLPDYKGSKIYSAIRDKLPNVPIILMTDFGYDSGHTLVKAREMGMKRTLFKPFKSHLLVAAIEENLANGSSE